MSFSLTNFRIVSLVSSSENREKVDVYYFYLYISESKFDSEPLGGLKFLQFFSNNCEILIEYSSSYPVSSIWRFFKF